MNETQLTRQTYEQIAAEYADRWATNDAVTQEARRRFLAHLSEGSVVLDVGCGPGRDARLLSQAGCDVVACDLSLAMLAEGTKQFTGSLVAADMRSLPFRPGTFHALWVCASLLHVPKHEAASTLRGFRNLLGAGGTLFVGVKEGEGEMFRSRDGLQRFFSFYSETEIADLIELASFSVLESWLDTDDVHPEPWINVIARAS